MIGTILKDGILCYGYLSLNVIIQYDGWSEGIRYCLMFMYFMSREFNHSYLYCPNVYVYTLNVEH